MVQTHDPSGPAAVFWQSRKDLSALLVTVPQAGQVGRGLWGWREGLGSLRIQEQVPKPSFREPFVFCFLGFLTFKNVLGLPSHAALTFFPLLASSMASCFSFSASGLSLRKWSPKSLEAFSLNAALGRLQGLGEAPAQHRVAGEGYKGATIF